MVLKSCLRFHNTKMQEIANSFECTMNREDGSLPYGYYCPETEGKLTWICGEDAEGIITSVFCFDYGTHKDKKSSYLEDLDKAKYCRDELIKNGWRPLKPPEAKFKFPDEKDPRTLSRKEKRKLAQYIVKQNKKNPFSEK